MLFSFAATDRANASETGDHAQRECGLARTGRADKTQASGLLRAERTCLFGTNALAGGRVKPLGSCFRLVLHE
jgi:hypothetical protein